MRKISALIMAVLLVLSLAACGGSATPAGEDEKNEETAAVANGSESENSETETVTPTGDWKQFLKEYEAFVDKYIEIYKKHKANALDTAVLGEYSKLATELADWVERSEKKLQELTVKEAQEYAAEIERISKKIDEAEEDG